MGRFLIIQDQHKTAVSRKFYSSQQAWKRVYEFIIDATKKMQTKCKRYCFECYLLSGL